jgi:CDP-diglyceride synthetase
MSTLRIRLWVALGAVIGAMLAVFVIIDVRQAISSGEVFPAPEHFVLCWPLILALILPSSLPRVFFYSLMTLLNACTFAFLFSIVGNIVHSIFSRTTKATAGGSK